MKAIFKSIVDYLFHVFVFSLLIVLLMFWLLTAQKKQIHVFFQSLLPSGVSDLTTEQSQVCQDLSQTISDARETLRANQEAEARAAQEAQAQHDLLTAALSAPTAGKQYGYIIIDRLNMNVPLYYGDDKATLRKGPGQYIGSSLPGGGGQIIIAGHNTTYFKPLQNVVSGDQIHVVTSYGDFYYQVTDIQIVSMNDTSSYNLNLDHEQLALYTCYPFSGPPGKTQRYFVYADRVNAPSQP